jgi:TolB-like protein/DNA-binding SARP family transcriptional activator/tetratricopeptide (TPR) repeat protein
MNSAPNPAVRIHVATLGGLRIDQGGAEVHDLPAQPVRCALFVYLALQRGATRDELTALLWPERDTERARHALSQTIYELRRRLGEESILTSGGRIDVAPSVSVDALEFVAAAEATADEAAVDQYRGAFLEGIHLGWTAAFESWVTGHRARLARLHRDACRRLIETRLEHSDAQGALAVARRWAELDPLEDEAHHRIIELLGRTGHRSEALLHYNAYAELIARELDVEPMDETRALIARIRQSTTAHEGPAPAEPATATPAPTPPRTAGVARGRTWAVGLTAAILAAGMIGVGVSVPGSFRPAAGAATHIDPRGIAVLPFVNMSPDPEQEYFSDGMMEDLLTVLSQISDLNVTARTSVMQYKGTTRTTREIGEELQVAHLVEGSVRRVGDRVRITAQLIDARTDRHLWAESYDRDLTDIFEIQSEVALQIARALQATITPDLRERLGPPPTGDLVAYDLYLLGRDHLHRGTVADNQTAVVLFRRALERDPSFARAWAGIARAHSLKVNHFGQPLDWADSAIHVARQALDLDPGLAEAHEALAGGYFVQGHFGAARQPAERALQLNPSGPWALVTLGNLLEEEGRLAEAARFFRRAIALDPARAGSALRNLTFLHARAGDFRRAQDFLDQAGARATGATETRMDAALLALLQGEYDEARRLGLELVARDPDYVGSWMFAGDAHLFTGDIQGARKHYARAYEMSPYGYYPIYTFRFSAVTLGYTLWKSGERDKALELFREFQDFVEGRLARGLDAPVAYYMLAAVHAIVGDRTDAIRTLTEAADRGWSDYIFLSSDPLFEDLHDDAGFQGIVERNRQRMEVQRALLERDRD